MKFIRTKSGFITTKERNDMLTATVSGLIEKYGDNDPIIKQADTIEDLCDRFIVEYESGNFTIFTDFRDLKKHFEYYPQPYHKVTGRYGAILVKGKGLIYKAKMNDEGELCLI